MHDIGAKSNRPQLHTRVNIPTKYRTEGVTFPTMTALPVHKHFHTFSEITHPLVNVNEYDKVFTKILPLPACISVLNMKLITQHHREILPFENV